MPHWLLLVAAWSRSVVWMVLPLMLVACTSYRQQPLPTAAVDDIVAPPTWPELLVRVADLHHPRLPATTIDPAGPFTPAQLAVMAVVMNPGLRARRAERSLADAQVLQAGILPNPTLALGADLAVSSPESRGSSLGVGWDFTGLITRGAKRASAQAHAEQVALDIAWEEWLIAASTTQAAVRLAGAEQRLAVLHGLVLALIVQRDLLVAGEAAGARTRFETHTAALALGDVERQVLEGDGICTVLRQQLNRLLGLPPSQLLAVAVPAWPTTCPVPASMVAELPQRRLDLIALRAGYDSQEEALRVAVLGQFPRISFDLVHATDTGKVRTLTLGASIDLPLFDRNQGAIASETATRERLFAEYGERLFIARADLAEAIATAESLERRIAHNDQMLATLSDSLAQVHQAATDHLIDAPTAAALEIDALQRRLDSLDLRQQLAENRIAIELAAGGLLGETSVGAAPTTARAPIPTRAPMTTPVTTPTALPTKERP